ncbi:hypothetical protein J3E68DRAFT_412472 [Trichoderma sp. SZMC 28012]
MRASYHPHTQSGIRRQPTQKVTGNCSDGAGQRESLRRPLYKHSYCNCDCETAGVCILPSAPA